MIKVKGQLRLKIVTIIITTAILPLLFGGMVILNRLQSSQTKQAFDLQFETAQRAVGIIEESINSHFDSFSQIPINDFLDQSDQTKKEKILTQQLKSNPAILDIAFVETSGQEQLKLSRFKIVTKDELINISSDPKFKAMLSESRQIFYSLDSQNHPVFSLSYQIIDLKGNVAGILVAKVDPKLQEVIENIRVGQKGSVYIVANDGSVVSHKDPEINSKHADFSKYCPIKSFTQAENEARFECRYTNNQEQEVLGTILPITYLTSVEKKTTGQTSLGVVTELPIDEALLQVSTMQKFIVTLLIITAVLASSIGVFSALQIVKSLEKLYQGVLIFGQGNLSHRTDIRTNDEIEQLSLAFNSMADNLQKAFTKLQQDKDIFSVEKNKLNVILSSIIDGIIALDLSRKVILVNSAAERITGYTFAEMAGQPIESLVHVFDKEGEILVNRYCPININNQQGIVYSSNEALRMVGKSGRQSFVQLLGSQIPEGIQTNLGCILIMHDLTREHELESMKVDFVSMASHELRTPLTSIIGYLSVFLDENKQSLNKDQKDLLDRVFISSKQLINLIENLLNVSKIERARLNVAVMPTDWQSLLERVVQDLQTQAVQKNTSLVFTPPQKPLPKVQADSLLITEVLNNLIGNAIKFTPQGGKVSVYTQAGPNEIVTTVEDTGPGIPKEALPHLFTKFFQVTSKFEQGSKGTGLGLYISREIINKHRGKIWVESELGKGTKFSFSIPVVTTSLPIGYHGRSFSG